MSSVLSFSPNFRSPVAPAAVGTGFQFQTQVGTGFQFQTQVGGNSFQTVGSINLLDPGRFEDTDKTAFGKHWDNCFFGNTVSDGIYAAVAAKAGSAPTLLSQNSKVRAN